MISFLLLACSIFSTANIEKAKETEAVSPENENGIDEGSTKPGVAEHAFVINSESGSGLIDCDGNWVIEPQNEFFISGNLANGLAPFYDPDSEQTGFLTQDLQQVFPQTFDSAMIFSDGLAAVLVEGKWGYIDQDGNYVIEPQYPPFSIGGFSDGLANVPYEVDPETGYVRSWIFIDQEGNQVLGPYYWAGPFTNGYAAVQEQRGDDYEDFYSGFINTNGEFVLEFNFQSQLAAVQNSAGEGLFGVADIEQEITSGECSIGFMNAEKQWVAEPQFCDVGYFNDGLAPVTIRLEDGATFLWGYINQEGEYIVEPQYNFAPLFVDGCAVVISNNWNNYSLIAPDGEVILEFE